MCLLLALIEDTTLRTPGTWPYLRHFSSRPLASVDELGFNYMHIGFLLVGTGLFPFLEHPSPPMSQIADTQPAGSVCGAASRIPGVICPAANKTLCCQFPYNFAADLASCPTTVRMPSSTSEITCMFGTRVATRLRRCCHPPIWCWTRSNSRQPGTHSPPPEA